MAKRNSSGSSSGRRGSSRTSSGGSFSRGKKSTGKPFKRSDSRSEGRPSSFSRDDKRPSGKGEGFDKRSSGSGRPFKKFDKPYGKREEGSSESASRSSGDRKKPFSSDSRKPPFKKFSSRESGDAAPRRPYKKFDKPFEKRDEGSSESRGGSSYGNRKRSFSSDSRKPPFKKFDSKDSSEPRSKRPYKKFDKPFEKRDEGSSESRGSSYGNRKRSFSSDSRKPPFKKFDSKDSSEPRSKRPFKKFDKPFEKPERSSDSGKSFGSKRRSSSKDEDRPKRYGARDSGKSFGTDENKSEGSSAENPIRKRSPRPFSESRGERKPPRERRDSSGEEPKGFFKKSKSRYSASESKNIPEELSAPAQTGKIRLNKYIANSGVCSRREADELITMGLISVNGKTISELGYKVNPGDEVRYENKVLTAEKPVYILMNKPKGYLTTTDDPQERNTVMHIIGSAVKERIYPVGRLDRNSTGLLLLTNDGDLADKLMHPSHNVKKIYKVELDRPLTKADFQKMSEGVVLEEGRAMVDDLAMISEDGKTVGIEIHIGWNRVIRRIFEALGYDVVRLDRSVYAGLDKKDLGRGHWRFLTKEELIRLKHYK